MHNLIFYSSHISIILFIILIYFAITKAKYIFKNKILFFCIYFSFITTSLFIYARFIERNIITKQETKINAGFNAKLIVISDIHLGIYKNANFLKRVVKKINNIKNADALLIAGDFIYQPKNNLEELFNPLKDIKIPVYAVLGNHDSQKPGPPIQKELQKVLEKNNIIFLHNSSAFIKKDVAILGLGDKWANQDKISKINDFKKSDNLIVLTHNPDTVLEYKNNIADLTISGHTHGGQIRIPFLYKNMIPCIGDFDQGLYNVNQNKVFVTTGIGEVGLPMRLGIPPVIDVLKLY